ncbi:uncharacterized protein DS421_5g145450 [Arachis hypogaea]|nr:uncharacterized protein DS421_5g145450 [Arachis hypogaea]
MCWRRLVGFTRECAVLRSTEAGRDCHRSRTAGGGMHCIFLLHKVQMKLLCHELFLSLKCGYAHVWVKM